MTTPKAYDVAHLQAIRVDLHGNLAGFYALIIPDPRKGPAFRDFYLVQDDTGRTLHMFGTLVIEDALAIDLAVFAAAPHIDTMLQEVE